MEPDERAWRERGLKEAVLAGDERAWQTWYDESYDALYAYATWRCAGRCDLADEVVQETWLTAVRRVRTFDPNQGSFAGWLRGIAANVLRNQFRRDRLRDRHRLSLIGTLSATPTPESSASDSERVAQALNQLPEHYEQVLRAKYLDQLSVAAIAAERNETPKAVESLLTRARQAFREAYLKQE